mmetsp:Transcript_2343/g.8968  ORF Transcript_2343/g.8968 Transcript_2343/m.8968 type:complete len:851 (-) Transcript_2343:613-3165(-)
MIALAQELADEEGRNESSRQLAGLHLKNLVSARESMPNLEKRSRWMEVLDLACRNEVKTLTLKAMRSTSAPAAHAAAQVVAKLGAIEVPLKQWPELLRELVRNMTLVDSGDCDLTKMVTLEALGYLCDDLDEDMIAHDETNQILTAIVDGLREDRTDNVRLSAAQALLNSLVFTRHNFEIEDERNMIMQVVCSASRSRDDRLRVVAFESLARIASLYYEKLPQYMNVLFTLTLEAMQSRHENEQVAMMAIEFWSTLCEEEIELLDDEFEQHQIGQVLSGQQTRVCARYMQQAAVHVINALLSSALTRQDESADVDAWNVAAAGAVCLSLISQAVGNDVVPTVLQFVEANILVSDWHYREASIMAFGQILDGPKPEVLASPIEKAMPVLVRALTDESTNVKDTAAWTLARICELHAPRIPQTCLHPLIESLLTALQDTARVAAQACFAVHNLAMACDCEAGGFKSSGPKSSAVKHCTNPLSPFFQPLLTQLLSASDRPDWQEQNLRGQAYEAVNMLIQCHAPDMRPVVVEVMRHVLQRLHNTFSMHLMSQDDRDERDQLQGMLGSVIQVIVRAVDPKEIAQFADHTVLLLLQVLQNQNAVASEEAFMALGALASSVEREFEKYMRDFTPFLLQGLRNYSDWQVCNAAVGTTGDICRALEERILPFCDDIIQCLLEDLQNPDLNRQVKPNVLASFGDIALAIGGNFEKYLNITLQMLDQAGHTAVPDDDEELMEYLNVLREGVLDAYTGIVQGLKDGGKASILSASETQTPPPHLSKIFAFIDVIAREVNDSKCHGNVLKHTVGLIGDLADVTPRGPASEFFKSPAVVILLRDKRETSLFKYAKSKIDDNHM